MAYALRSPRRVPAIIGILLTAAIIIPVLPDAFWDRMKTIKPPDPIAAARGTMTGDDESSLGRLHFWNVALRMADDRPLVGVGYNSYNANYDNYDDTKGAFGYSRSVHSAWFGVLAELGYPGLFLFVAQIILAFRACARARKAAKLGSEYADLGKFAFALEASLVAFIVGGTFLPFQHTEMLWHVLGLTIALDILARTALASSTVDVWSRSVAPAYVPVSAAALVS